MTEYIHLIGAEQVQSAGRQMQDAAETIRNATGHAADLMQLHTTRMDEAVARFEAAVDRLCKALDAKEQP